MSLWGTKDTVYSVGKVNCTAPSAGVATVTKQTGAGLDFTASCKVGMVVTLADDGSGPGQGVILGITSATMMTLSNVDLPGAFTAVNYEVRETPVAEVKGGNFGINEVFGVDNTEIGIATGKTGDARKYAPAHAGWVGIQTFNNHDGTLRVKTEVLVAMGSDSAGNGGITGDSGDDTIFADS